MGQVKTFRAPFSRPAAFGPYFHKAMMAVSVFSTLTEAKIDPWENLWVNEQLKMTLEISGKIRYLYRRKVGRLLRQELYVVVIVATLVSLILFDVLFLRKILVSLWNGAVGSLILDRNCSTRKISWFCALLWKI